MLMKILFIIDNLGSGGSQKQLVNMALKLTEIGHKTDIYAYNFKTNFFQKDLFNKNINIIENHKLKSGFSVNVIVKLRKILFKNQYDVALAFLNPSSIYLLLSSFGINTKVIVAERSSYLAHKYKFILMAQRQMYRLANHIICNSHTQMDWLIKKAKIPKNKISVIYNGYKIAEKKAAIKRIDFKYTLISIGRIHNEKNIHILIEALIIFYKLHNWIPKIKWIGRIDSTDYFKYCDKLIKSHNYIEDIWEWCGEKKTFKNYVLNSDALIHTALYDGLSNVICESLVSGHPVLAGNVCDNKYLIGKNERGILFNPNDPHDIANAIKVFYKLSFDKVENFKINAKNYADKNLHLDQIAFEYNKLFNNLQNESKSKKTYSSK